MDLSVSVGSLRLANPVIAASGCFGYGVEYGEVVDLSMLGAVAVKGLFLAEREGHPPARIVETPSGMLNAIGLQGIGAHRFVREKLPELRARRAVVVVNICGSTVDEYCEIARILSDYEGVAAIELNISCPNIKEGGITFGCSLAGTHDVVSAVRKVTRLPLIPKLTPNVTDVASFARAAADAGADGVSLVNTFLAMAIDVHSRRPKLSNIVGGLSGPAIRPIAVRMVYECRLAVTLPIIGMGGIATADDVLEFMIAGATAVQVGTANFSDPFIWTKLLEGLGAYMTRHDVPRIAELTGSLDTARKEQAWISSLIALDVDSRERALGLADSLRGVAGGFKIGKRLFTSQGPSIVRALVERGDRVFLDLKFHDIPSTVAQAVAASAALGVWMVNVHASGGRAMMQAARDAAHASAVPAGGSPPIVIAVTVLTSMNAAALAETGVHAPVLDHAVRLAQLAQAAGLDGVVASPLETSKIRERCGAGFAIVTPGIRGVGAGTAGQDDQMRTMSAGEAIAAGASYIVVGRPIIAAPDPRAAAEGIVAEMESEARRQEAERW